MSRPQNSCSSLTQPQKQPIGSKKLKKDLKIMSKSKVKIEGTLGNKSCSTTWIDPKAVLKPTPSPKIAQ